LDCNNNNNNNTLIGLQQQQQQQHINWIATTSTNATPDKGTTNRDTTTSGDIYSHQQAV